MKIYSHIFSSRFFAKSLFFLLLSCLCQPEPAAYSASASPEELQIHQLGIAIGYGRYCLQKAGIKSIKDAEARPFGEYYGKPLKAMGQKGALLFSSGVKKGVFNAAGESGENCRQRLEYIIKLYKEIGLQGTLYNQALKKYK